MKNAWSLDASENAQASPSLFCIDGLISPLIDALGESDFGQRLVARVNELTMVDFFSVYQLRAKEAPRMFLSSSRSGHDVSRDCFHSYQQNLYTQDHTFDEAIKLLRSHATAMAYTHNSYFAPPHRAAIYSRHGIQDRLSVVSKTENGLVLATNFYRFKQQPLFSDNDIDAVQSVARSVATCVSKHISLTDHLRRFSASNNTAMLSEQLALLHPQLSARELEVCIGLLAGRTYDGIAVDLGVSLATVKTYRARAYEKLGINFRSQLFAIASGLIC